MTDNEFDQGLIGSMAWTIDRKARLCDMVAAGLSQRAKERQAEGRPDKASLLR